MVALDKHTGEERWRKERPGELTSWSTPLVSDAGRVRVIVAAGGRTRSYDIRNGEVLWSLSGLGMNVIPHAHLRRGDPLPCERQATRRMQAVDLRGARGDLDGSGAVLWSRDRDTPYVSTPLSPP